MDRLDYTKGIYARLRAYAELIHDGHFDVEDAVFVQVAVPSREQVEEYKILRDEIDRLVGRINGDLGRIGRPAISYLHSSYPREEMAALYRAADIMVVTPYRDGMNLVAKEYVASQYDDAGALVLSEFAGAAAELRQAWLVNPYDINGMKSALLEAYRADEKDLDQADARDAQDRGQPRRGGLGGQLHDRADRRTRRAREVGQAGARAVTRRHERRWAGQRVGGVSDVGRLPAMIPMISSRRAGPSSPQPGS